MKKTILIIAAGICSIVNCQLNIAQPTANFTFNYSNGACTPDTVAFTNTSTGADSYKWNFGDFSPLYFGFDTVHVYTWQGTFMVTLTVYDMMSGDSSVVTKPVIINQTPWPGYANFWYNPMSPVCPGIPVQFNIPFFLMPPPIGRLWTFGDGDSTNENSPIHAFQDTGSFTVTHILYAQCGSDTFTNVITVDSTAKPTSGFSAWPNLLCPNQDIDVWNSSQGATSYLWVFGDGDSSNVFDPVKSYSAIGNYNLQLFTFNACGSDTAAMLINVVDTITPTVSAWVNDDSICTNTTVNFSGWSNYAISYFWTFGDGFNSLQQNPSHAYSALGTYTATFTATNSCGNSKSVNLTIRVLNNLPPETVNFYTTPWTSCPGTAVCPGKNLLFNNTSSDLGTSFWNFGDGFTSNQNNPMHAFADTGTYSVKLVVTSSCGGKDSITQCVPIRNNVVPGAWFCINTCMPPQPVCVGSNVNFINNSSDTTNVVWDFGDGDSSVFVNPSHIYADTGVYIVTLRITNTCGNSAVSSQALTVTTTGNPPDLMGLWVNPTTICPGQTITFNAWSMTATSYKWLFGDGDTGTMSFTNHAYMSPDTYLVAVIAYNGCGTDTMTTQVFVKNGPSPDFTFTSGCPGDPVTFTDNSTPPPASWAWDFSDGDTSSAQNPVHVFISSGMYNVLLIAADSNCSSQIQKQVIIGIDFTVSAVNTTCSQPNGQATANVLVGNAPFTYSWSSGQTTSVVTGLLAGTYGITVTGGTGCIDSASVNINNNGTPSTAPASASASPDTVCAGGSTTVTVSGGSLGDGANWIWHSDSCSGPGVGSGASLILPPPATTTYFVRAEGICNTTSCAAITVAVLPVDDPSFSYPSNTYCQSSPNPLPTVTGTPGGTFSGPPQIVFVSAATGEINLGASAVGGPYTVVYTTNGVCPGNAPFTITITAPVNDATFTYADPFCQVGVSPPPVGPQVGSGTFSASPAGLVFTDVVMGTINLGGSSAGSYTVTHIIPPSGGCPGDTATDTVTIDPAATVSAGVDDTICKNSTYVLSGTIGGGATSSTWTTSGTGNFDNPALPNAIYTPSNADEAMGAVTLTLTTDNPPGMCPAVSDAMVLTILNGAEATAGAGADAIICEGSSYTLSGTRGGSATSSTWTTSGDGIFNDPSLLAATYTPGSADNTMGSVTLTITTNDPPGICPAASDYMILTINPAAIANAGTDASVCAGNPITLSGAIGGSASSAVWSTSGDGSYNNPALLTATYTPGVTDISMGTVTLTLTTNDPAGPCLPGTDLMVLTITSLPAPSITVIDASCNGLCNGSESATVSGGASPFTYLWSASAGSQTASSATGLCTGSHSVTVTDSKGCSGSSSASVSEPVVLTSSITATVDASCAGLCNGSATITAADGTPPYSYLWDDPGAQIVQTATGLCAGNFSVTVTDNNGCTATSSTAITEPAAVSATAVSDSSTCGNSDGSASLTASGGTPPYAYLWNDLLSQTNDTAINLSSGAYTATVTDANGCTVIVSTTVNDIGAPVTSVSVVNNVYCAGGSNGEALANVSGGTPPYGYTWLPAGTGNGAIVTNLSAGTYFVTVSDTSGCQSIASGIVTEPAVLAVTASSTDAHCGQSDGSLSAIVSGGTPPYTFLWMPGGYSAAMVNVISAGNYFITVSDMNGCSITDSVTVNDLPGGTVSLSSSTDASCNSGCDGIATATTAGGFAPFTYVWNTTPVQSSATATGLCAGNFTVVALDTFGCSDSITVTINEPAALSLTGSAVNATCNGVCDGLATVLVSGGIAPYGYLWDDPFMQTTDTSFNLCAGVVSVTVVDVNNCTATELILVNQPAALSLSLSSTDASCGNSDGSAAVAVAGGTAPYGYQWDDLLAQTTDTASGLAAGVYSITVTDVNSCTGVNSTAVNNAGAPSLTFSLSDVTCNGSNDGSASLTVTGGTPLYTYLWSNGDTLVTTDSLGGGAYTVTVTDALGCIVSASVTIMEPAALTVSVVSIANLNCYGDNNGSVDISAGGGTVSYSYNWSDGSTAEDISGAIAGSYDVTVTDANGCTLTDSSVITEPAVLVAIISNVTNTSCGLCDGDADISVSGGVLPYTFLWSDPGAQTTSTATGLCATNYEVSVTDANGCFTLVVVSVPGAGGLTSSIASNNNATCANSCDGDATVSAAGGSAPYTYLWDDPMAQDSITATGLCAGVFLITVTDNSGCITTSSVAINEPTLLVTAIDSINATCGICPDGSASLIVTGGTPPYAYSWSNGAVTQNIDSVLPATYYVTVTDVNGCIITDSVAVGFTVGIAFQPGGGVEVNLFPNPTNGKITLEIKLLQPVDEITISVINVLGQIVMKSNHTVSGNNELNYGLDLTGYPEGIYLLKVTGEDDIITQRFAVNR